jgi:hypothetical protein
MIGTPHHWQLCWRSDWREPARSSSERPTGARRAQHAAGDFNNRHVEIVCAASAHVNVSVLYQFVDPANWPWPIRVALRQGLSRSGSAWTGRSQKDGLPSCRGRVSYGSRPSTRAQGGAAWSLPLSNPEREWTPRRRETLLCSPPCRSSAQASPGFWITLFLVWSFLRSV